jgi:hypothetical protein
MTKYSANNCFYWAAEADQRRVFRFRILPMHVLRAAMRCSSSSCCCRESYCVVRAAALGVLIEVRRQVFNQQRIQEVRVPFANDDDAHVASF